MIIHGKFRKVRVEYGQAKKKWSPSVRPYAVFSRLKFTVCQDATLLLFKKTSTESWKTYSPPGSSKRPCLDLWPFSWLKMTSIWWIKGSIWWHVGFSNFIMSQPAIPRCPLILPIICCPVISGETDTLTMKHHQKLLDCCPSQPTRTRPRPRHNDGSRRRTSKAMEEISGFELPSRGGSHIPPKGKSGKSSFTQMCRLIGDMFAFPGGYHICKFSTNHHMNRLSWKRWKGTAKKNHTIK